MCYWQPMRIRNASFAAAIAVGGAALAIACSSSSSSGPANNPEPDAGQPPPGHDSGPGMVTVAPDAAYVGGQGDARTLTVVNKCRQTIWVTANPLTTLPGNGFVQMDPGNAFKVGVANGWTGALWARTYCGTDAGVFGCETDPTVASRAELALAADPTTGQDTYDISFVNGFNVPIGVLPVGVPPYPANPMACGQTACPYDLTQGCPTVLQASVEGQVLGCANNACQTLGHGNTSDPNCMYPNDNTNYFKYLCPTAYSYPTDDATSKFTCSGGNDYEIVFCP